MTFWKKCGGDQESETSRRITELLDESMVVDQADQFNVREHNAQYQIDHKGKVWDLSKINFEKLREEDERHILSHDW
jgi:type I restriction enzyme R subunit